MSRRMALITAGGLTAFVLVLMGALAAMVMSRSTVTLQADARESDIRVSDLPARSQAQPSSGATVRLQPAEASRIALAVAPGARLNQNPDLVNFQGTIAYEITSDQGPIYVDANSGKVLYNAVAGFDSGPAPFGGERHHEGEHEEDHGEGHHD